MPYILTNKPIEKKLRMLIKNDERLLDIDRQNLWRQILEDKEIANIYYSLKEKLESKQRENMLDLFRD